MELDELIKELDSKLVVTGKETKDDIMYIYCDTKSNPQNANIVEKKVKMYIAYIQEQYQIYLFKNIK